jgi:hypothetical protein
VETWATFSIIDHRNPVYRQSLALFDRIVVPVPPMPIGDQTQEELDQLKAEVDYLVRQNAAKRYEWSSQDFQEWRRPLLAEAIASGLNRDAFQDTRLMVAKNIHLLGPETEEVQAVPVYGGMEQYAKLRQELMVIVDALTIEIVQRLPVPEEDTPLENLVHLRENPAFRKALDDLLEWKRLRAPAIAMDADRPKAIAAAMRDFDKITKEYAEAMESEGHKRVGSVGSIFFALVTGDVLGAIKEGLVSFREVREPCWKKVSAMKCAPGGVVYHFKEALR